MYLALFDVTVSHFIALHVFIKENKYKTVKWLSRFNCKTGNVSPLFACKTRARSVAYVLEDGHCIQVVHRYFNNRSL